MSPLPPRFQGKTVIVTGGGRGIGRGITCAFARSGASVIICGRHEAPPFEGDIAPQIHFIALDIKEPSAANSLIDFTMEKTSRLDVLINNAGGGPPVASATASPRLTESVIRLNLLAPLNLSQAAFQAMQKNTPGNDRGEEEKINQNKGSIINISSVSATRSSPGSVAYGAAKAGLLNVTTSLAMEWAPTIRVNAIIAGLVETEASADHYGGARGMRYLADALPMKRMAQPQDIAHACLFLADETANYVSGACLEVHGGGEPPSFLKIAEEAIKQGDTA